PHQLPGFDFSPRQYETATYTQTSNLSLLLGQYTFPTSRNIYVHTGGTPSLVLHNRIRSCFLVIWAVCTSGISTYSKKGIQSRHVLHRGRFEPPRVREKISFQAWFAGNQCLQIHLYRA